MSATSQPTPARRRPLRLVGDEVTADLAARVRSLELQLARLEGAASGRSASWDTFLRIAPIMLAAASLVIAAWRATS